MMSNGHVNPELAKLPLDRIADICQRYGVSTLAVHGLWREANGGREEETIFLVTFRNDDFGPWGAKLDELENDLSGLLHQKVHVASRMGIEQSSIPPRRDSILESAQRIYES
jgi:predicted nucleotidyltransferase